MIPPKERIDNEFYFISFSGAVSSRKISDKVYD
jgi:hypothetical protein